MKPIQTADGKTVVPNPPGYWWRQLGALLCALGHQAHSEAEKARKASTT
jgi:hypothetical protein